LVPFAERDSEFVEPDVTIPPFLSALTLKSSVATVSGSALKLESVTIQRHKVAVLLRERSAVSTPQLAAPLSQLVDA